SAGWRSSVPSQTLAQMGCVVRFAHPTTWGCRLGVRSAARFADRWRSPYLTLPRNCAETRNSCSTLLLTPVQRWCFSSGWQMIAVLAAPSAPLFTPQRGAPPLPRERLAPKHPGGQFSFWRKLAADPRRHRPAYGRRRLQPRGRPLPPTAVSRGRSDLDRVRRADSMGQAPRGFGVRLGQLFSRAACLSGRRPCWGQLMRISLCNEVVRELSFERQCAFARAVGYDGLEIAPFTLGQDPHL